MNRLLPASWRSSSRRGLAMMGTFVSIDLRRPASWITLATGGWIGWWWCGSSAAAGTGIVMLAAAALAVAAIGDAPLADGLPAGRGRPVFWGFEWTCERAAWPLVGMMLGMLAAGGGPQVVGIMAAAAIGAVLAAVTTAAGRLSGATAADAASLTLLVAASSAAAGEELASRLTGSCMDAAAVWLLLCGLGWAWSRSQRAATDAFVPGTHRAGHGAGADVLHFDALPANGPLRQTLTRLAMVAALAAMAGWLMFEPAIDSVAHAGGGQAGWWNERLPVHRAALAWAAFTAAWFIGLAVPQATLQDGVCGADGWDRLLRTAAHVPHGTAAWRLGIWRPRLGSSRFAGGVALTQAAILGWPVLVCAALSLPTPATARLPMGIVIGLGVVAVAVWAVFLLGAAVHASRETSFAATLALVVISLVAATEFTVPLRQPPRRGPPSLPSLAPPALHSLRGG